MQPTLPLQTLLRTEPTLAFVPSFLSDFPEADIFLVGGAVRDAILSRPVHDLDLVIRGVSAAQLEPWFGARGKVAQVGRDFGVIKFQPTGHRGKEIDIALPRVEHALPESLGGYRDFDVQADPNLPIESDLSRRDFTINSLAYNLRTSVLVDPFKGVDDVHHRVIRAVGNPSDRFSEDLTRVLRAIRFAAELAAKIEPETWSALKNLTEKLNLTRIGEDGKEEFVVPREVLGKEVGKALLADANLSIVLLRDSGALKTLLPVIDQRIETDLAYLDPIGHGGFTQLTVILTLLLRAMNPNEAAQAVRDLGLNAQKKESPLHVIPQDVAWMLEQLQNPEALLEITHAPGSKFECFFMNGRSEMFLPLLKSLEMTDIVDAAKKRREHILSIWKVSHHKHIPRLISGDDILALGVEQGPRVRELLNLIRDGQLDGTILRREDAMRKLKASVE